MFIGQLRDELPYEGWDLSTKSPIIYLLCLLGIVAEIG